MSAVDWMELTPFGVLGMVFLIGEVLAFPFYYVLHRHLSKKDVNGVVNMETVKGWSERIVLLFGLWLGYPHVLTLFSALKIANRFKIEESDDLEKSYFVIGNLVSVLLVFVYLVIARVLLGLPIAA